MNKRSLVVLSAVVLVIALSTGIAHAALNLEGQSGIFLNTLAYTNPASRTEFSSHTVNLDKLGAITTYNVSTSLKRNIDLGFTRVSSSVTGIDDQNLILGKWQFAPETKSRPAAAVWVIQRNRLGGDDATDLGLSTTKIVTAAKHPLVLDLGVRSTKAIGLGLFGVSADRKTKFEGSVAYFVTPKFAVGAEFKQQIGIDTWRDIAFRYVASDDLNIDFGIANLNSALDNQVALAATRSF